MHQLADALGLSSDDRITFEAAARSESPFPRGQELLPAGTILGARPERGLIAREEEHRRLRSALESVQEGTGHVLLLGGELGIGKTRLLNETLTDAWIRGCVVLGAQCSMSDQLTPLAPLMRALGGLAAAPPDGLRTDVQHHWKRISRMATAFSTDGARGGTVDQQELFRAITNLLLLLTRSGPIVLVIDDLQWADDQSLLLLPHLARATRSARVLLLGAFRDMRITDEHPALADLLQTLSRERLAERIALRRLSLEETTRLVGVLMGDQPVSEEFAHFVYRRTKGIPRLVEQLVRSLGGRLELQGEIGAGAMGRVFKAFDRKRAEEVAAKLVLPRSEIDLDTLLRFQQEGAILALLDHPSIVQIYDTFAEEHASCIVMEFLEGQSLGQVLQDGPLSLGLARAMALQVADALAYAHSQEIAHRDIKPDNVMVLPGDQVKVTDFGIARILQPDTSLHTIVTTGMRMGTPLYMAPEQIEGKKIDGRTDLYALGAMLYHMVTGRPPFEGGDVLAEVVKHLQEEPLAPSQVEPTVPKEWDAVILKALAKEPRNRYRSAGEMRQTIEALPLKPARPQTRRPTRGAISGVVAGTATSVVAAIVALALLWPHFAARQGQSSLGRTIDGYLTSLANQHHLSGTVLVAQKGRIILAKGYGMANRTEKVPNSPNTIYPGGVASVMAIVAGLKLENQGILHGKDRVCSYLSFCPRSWKPMTIGMLLGGTSGLPQFDWGIPGQTTGALALPACEHELLAAIPGTDPVSYQNCTWPVLGTVLQKATGRSFATVMRRLILAPAGMRHTGYLVDRHPPSGLAEDYSGAGQGQHGTYNGYFVMFTTADDLYRFDNALFGGRILSQNSLSQLFALRSSVIPSDPDIQGDSWGYRWKIGTAFGHQVIYTNGRVYSFYSVDMRFPATE